MNEQRIAWFVKVESGNHRKYFIVAAQTERSARMQVSRSGCRGWQVLQIEPLNYSHAFLVFDNHAPRPNERSAQPEADGIVAT